MMTTKHKIRFENGRRSRKVVEGVVTTPPTCGRVPRVSRVMALAIRLEELIRTGVAKDQSALAKLGHISRVRMTQIMNLNLLAPDIQEEVLHLPLHLCGREVLKESELREIAAVVGWGRQREMWALTAQNVIGANH